MWLKNLEEAREVAIELRCHSFLAPPPIMSIVETLDMLGKLQATILIKTYTKNCILDHVGGI